MIVVDYLGDADAVAAGLPRGASRSTALHRAASRPKPSLRRGCRSTIRSTSCIPRARPACRMHRARRRRHAAPASEGAPAALRPAAGRPRLLLHHLRLDDVELAGLGARRRRDAGALRRLAVPSAPATSCSTSPQARADHALRHLGEVHRRAARRPGSSRASTHDLVDACARSSRPARRSRRRASTTSTSASRRDVHLASISGGTDIVSCFVLGDPDRAGVARRDPGAAASAWRSRSSTTTASPCAARRASWSAPGRFRRCRSASGTIPTARSIAPPISSAFPASGATATSPS